MDDIGLQSSPLDRARSIGGVVRDEALAGERLGRLTDRTAEAILAANLCSIVVPAEAGGLGASRVALFEATEEIARADGSAGWCVGLCNGVNAGVHRAGTPELRREVFGAGPVSCWGSLLPRGRAEREGDGFRLRGAFGFGSGSSISSWALVASPLPDRDGFQWFRGYVVPRADIEIRQGSWDVMGLKATHSVDYDIDAFVPAHRTFEYPLIPEANPAAQLGQIGMAAFASGVANGALADLVELAPKTKRLVGGGVQAEDHGVQFGIGELEGRLKAARAWYLELLARADAADDAGERTGLSLDSIQAAQTLTRAARDAAVFAFDSAGTTVIYADQRLQRAVRDLFAGLKHTQLNPSLLGRIGKLRLGVELPQVRL
jgi:alkylation response protein AidB-like acyl-CoA dehydrogenase